MVFKGYEWLGDGGGCIVIEGVVLFCGVYVINLLVLMFYELVINLVKFGVLSLFGGYFDICWCIEGDDVVFDWVEWGGLLIVVLFLC